MSFLHWLTRREYDLRPKIGDLNFVMRRIFTSLEAYHHWGDGTPSECGAVFNLEFSPEGNILVAACEKSSILLFDAITTKQTYKVPDAHMDSVNCIKFLNNRMFATCSDDSTVALWDLRYLNKKVRSLRGHSNWVKNIEFSHKDNLLVTSGFDGSIFTWDINSHTEQGLIYQKVFHTSGLMRCRISPDGTKLLICTTGGYLMIIHDLDLKTLYKDLNGFRPSIYRLMQMGHQFIPQAAKFEHVFSKKQKTNRVELVTDFPEQNDAEVISALQIHPHGHSFLSRNNSYDESTEWSCIHDINEEPGDITETIKEPNIKRRRKMTRDNDDESTSNEEGPEDRNQNPTDDIIFSLNRRSRLHRLRLNGVPVQSTPSPPPPPPPVANIPNRPDIWAAEVTHQERTLRQNRARSSTSVTGYNFVYAINSGVIPSAAAYRSQNILANYSNVPRNSSSVEISDDNRHPPGSPNPTTSSDGSSTSSSGSPPYVPFERTLMRSLISQGYINMKERPIFQNPKKLMYYIQEINKGKGFIKEPCFSADGRIICSPYDNGIRLLGFCDNCSEYPHYYQTDSNKRNPKQLVVVKTFNLHSDIVLSSKFSPHNVLVSGCRSGKIIWYHPNL